MCLGAQVPEIMTKQYVNDDDGNIYRSKLGVYRGNQPAFHNDHPVIFENDSSAPNMLAHGAAGFLTNEKGIVGTFSSKSYLQGKTRLIVYGDPKSGKASSWTLLEWQAQGKSSMNLILSYMNGSVFQM